jgi:putative PIG3 family NAD(P)H quinone oxidoreductase
MRAVVVETSSDLSLRDIATPEPGPGEARVRIRACGLNRADLLQRRGHYPAPSDAPADILGLEIAGEVDALGPGAHDVRVGEPVFAVISGGGYAEAVVVPTRTLVPIPVVNGRRLGFVEAAAIPEAFITAYDAMVVQAELSAGETVLIHAVGSGVGIAALQIARAIGARVVGTARTEEKLERARAMGMEQALLVTPAAGAPPEFARRAREMTGGRGVNVVLELVGGAYVPESLASLALRGRLVLVGLMAGAQAELDLGTVLRRRLRIQGTVLRARPLEEKILAARLLADHLAPLFSDGKLVPVVDRVFPLERADDAHRAMSSNETFGKVVLEIQ